MDAGKEVIHKEARQARAKDVPIVFVNPTDFNIVDEEGNMKYIGTVKEPVNCTCPSFINLNTEQYARAHAEPAKCKHIYKAELILSGERT